ncbi:ABC-F family ATP-binding cassette domain-containing protein [uncultured Alistipes sp.]|uniref:ABC-F family ATP-binding cassette domain-containing protein n=1 Tax=uncultured Alistipes sp. TaxID=538949 RepID=UPI0025D3F923|nr:ABC-F family ATP-binding cassette domain-containing protein [uncultured Alistipes sp.]
MSIILSGVSFRYTNQQILFEGCDLSVAAGCKASVVGNNGAGKSTLLKLIAGQLEPLSGSISCSSHPYYIPQQIGISGIRVSRALDVEDKIAALHAICAGSTDAAHYDVLADDWDIESRCRAALDHWGLTHVCLTAPVDTLSGGEKTKLLLAGLSIHKPDVVLLDEPTNHLDQSSRRKLYDLVRTSRSTILVVSHDVTLLNLLDETYELSQRGLKLYGGNYGFYDEQKRLEEESLDQQITSEQAALRLARRRAQEVRERQEKRMRQGETNKDLYPRILRKTMKDSGERANARLGDKHAGLVDDSRQRLGELRQQQRERCELKIDFDDAQLHDGKRLIATHDLNFEYTEGRPLWQEPLDLEIRSGERIRLAGDNGSGKTSFIRLITGELTPTRGSIDRAGFSYVYLDQEYSRVSTPQTVLELAQAYNYGNLQDHELKMRLHRALFPQDMWDKACNTLSGGERMRLYLCCLMISNHVPDLFILDEPTNNLDLSSLAILTHTVRNYRGTLLVISHDQHFIDEIGVNRTIGLQ